MNMINRVGELKACAKLRSCYPAAQSSIFHPCLVMLKFTVVLIAEGSVWRPHKTLDCLICEVLFESSSKKKPPILLVSAKSYSRQEGIVNARLVVISMHNRCQLIFSQ